MSERRKWLKNSLKLNKTASCSETYKRYKVRDDESIWQVCNSGDYQPSNQIVFWEGWGVWVHQKWYGILNISDKDWLWTSWDVFGTKQSQYLQCCLCPNKGGPMKPTNILSSDDFLIETGTGIEEKSYQRALK